MGQAQLYEATRGICKVGSKRALARFAFSVFHGVVRAIFEIESWHSERTTPYHIRVFHDPSPHPDRYEFVTEIPKTSVGKFRKTELREMFAGEPAAVTTK